MLKCIHIEGKASVQGNRKWNKNSIFLERVLWVQFAEGKGKMRIGATNQ